MSNVVFFSILFGFLSGIACRSLLSVGLSFVPFLLLLAVLSLASYIRWKRVQYVGALCFLVAAVFGIVRVELMPRIPPADLVAQIGEEVQLTGTVAVDPDIREASQRVTIRREDGSQVLAIVPRYPEVRYGEYVAVRGSVERPEPFSTHGGRMFRYDRFLEKDGVLLLVSDAEISMLGPRQGIGTHMMGALIDTKLFFMNAVASSLPEPHASLASGMLFGGKQGLGDDLIDAFTITGLVHIVVLSGYNIMIIAEAVMRVLGFLPRRLALIAAAACIGSFVLAAGAGAAAFRAGLMALIGLFARATGRTYDALRALGAAALIMLLINPLLLAYDPGFQLSAVATLGLILGAPLVEERLRVIKFGIVREIAATTIAAQIFVLPLLLYQTGNLSLVSLPANLLVLPFIPIAMFLSFAGSIFGSLLPVAAPLMGLPAYAVLSYVLYAVELFAQLPLAQVTLPAFPFWITVAMYVLLALGVVYARRKSTQSPRASAFLEPTS